MLRSLARLRAPAPDDVQAQLRELRADSLKLVLTLLGAVYLAWHIVFTLVSPSDQMLQALQVAFLAVPTFGAAYALVERRPRTAVLLFLAGSLLAVTWALWLFDSPQLVTLYAMLALVGAVAHGPCVGALVTLASFTLLLLVGELRPSLIDPTPVLSTAVLSGLVILGSWAETRHLLLALDWYSRSYALADRQTREAREHRAQLVQAWKQLDNAYYRLEQANAALQRAWKAADEAERSKMEFAVNTSHELRTPLNLIIGYAEMMLTSPVSYGGVRLPAPYWGDMNAVYQSAQHLLRLTDDVLDLGRMEIGHIGLVRETADIGRVIQDAAVLVGDYASGRGLWLRLVVPDELPPLLIDRLRIRQVLLNLLINAIRFTESGGITVEVSRRESDLRVAVSDTGPGIPAEDLAHVFDRFMTRGRAPTDWHSGTGLGLPISKRFVELHGGEMGVGSAPGEGTTFWFTLPLAPANAEISPSETGRPAPGRSGLDQVLVLSQPDPDLARLLGRHLEGCRVEAARGFDRAVARAIDLKAVAVIADLDDPTEPADCSVPSIRFRLPKASRLAERLGVADYLIKPVARETLLSTIGRLTSPVDRVLIVDDDVRFVRFLDRVLASSGAGYQVAAAYSGEEALQRLRDERFDLVLLDLVMPGLDGFGVLRQITLEPSLGRPVVIVVSASGERVDSAPLGEELHVRKPGSFQLAELVRVVGAVVTSLAPDRTNLEGAGQDEPSAGLLRD